MMEIIRKLVACYGTASHSLVSGSRVIYRKNVNGTLATCSKCSDIGPGVRPGAPPEVRGRAGQHQELRLRGQGVDILLSPVIMEIKSINLIINHL